MQTSVLRTVTEYPSPVVIVPDTKYNIPDPDAKPKHLISEVTKWHQGLCSDMDVELIHTTSALTSEFVTIGYSFMTTSADRWISVLPTLNTHVGTHTITLRIKFTDSDYSAITKDVPVAIEILPCEIKSIVNTGVYDNPHHYVIYRDT